ncbi:MAG: hypothetical protein KKG88_11000 [Proteobacteria bacterium]|nr:hypothetical protein [Pseudomonadota bacterium]
MNLTDHIAIAAKEKAEKKALFMSKIRATKPTGKMKRMNPAQEQEMQK